MNLNIGCGTLGREKGEVGIDVDIKCKPTVQGNIEYLPFKSESLDKIKASHVLEHVRDIVGVMNECHRALKPSGKMEIMVPMFPNIQAVVDPTHVRFFVKETFGYFCREGALPGLKRTFNLDDVYNVDWQLCCILEKPNA